MISAGEIKHLADLARIEVSAEETVKLQHDLNAILDYVSELKSAPSPSNPAPECEENFNQLRDDDEPEPSVETASYVRVKKIL